MPLLASPDADLARRGAPSGFDQTAGPLPLDHHHEDRMTLVPTANPAHAPAIDAVATGLKSRRKLVSTAIATHAWVWWAGQSRSGVDQREKAAWRPRTSRLSVCSLVVVGIEFSEAVWAHTVTEFRCGVGLDVTLQGLPGLVFIPNSFA